MNTARCHFLPLSAAKSIPSCNITTKSSKRFIGELISVGSGAVTLGISAANSMQILSVQQQVALVEKSLTEYSQSMKIQGAQLAKIQARHIELAEELQVT